jgi:hypothetical protein
MNASLPVIPKQSGFECAHYAGSDEMPFVRRNRPQQVEPDGKFSVGRIEIRHVFHAVPQNAV